MEQKKNTLKELLNTAEVKSKFQAMLGDNAEAFGISVLNVTNTNSTLQTADPKSILFAAGIAASLSLPIDPNLGFAYIVPYNITSKDGSKKTMAQFQMGYKGFIQLAMRSGVFKTLGCIPVYENETDEDVQRRINSIIEPDRDDEKVVGYAAYFKLTNGFEKSLYMTINQLRKHGLKYSKSFNRSNSLWQNNFEAMASKTVLKLLISKYAPLSIDMQMAAKTDQAIVNDWDGTDVTYADNEADDLDAEQYNNRKEEERVVKFIESASTLEQIEGLRLPDSLKENPKVIEALQEKRINLDTTKH